MTKILKFVLLIPFKNRIIGFISLFIVLVLFFRYFELQPSGEKKDISVGPVTLHVNSVEVHRRAAKPIDDTQPCGSTISQLADTSTVVPTLPASTETRNSQLKIEARGEKREARFLHSQPADPPTVLTQSPDGRFHPTVPVSYTQPQSKPEILDGAFTAPPPAQREAIRIGTVCLDKMNVQKMSDPMVLETLVQTAHEFDLLAVQGFYDTNLNAIKKWVDALNADGSTFGYLAAYPPVFKRDKNYCSAYVAFLYNRRAVDADRNTLLVLEAGERIACAPIAALFTTRPTPQNRAFTFIALNVWITPTNAQAELNVLQQTYAMVRDHIRGEDDILILGDFGTNINYTPDIVRNPKLNWIFTSPIGNYRNQDVTANIVFYDNSCTEFLNQSGTFNVEKLTGFTPTQIQTFMPTVPLWGKFDVMESKK